MLGNWKNWCRLCAKIDSATDESVNKRKSSGELLEIANKYFTVSLPEENLLICDDCSNFLLKLENFEERCLKVDIMLKEISEDQNMQESNLQAMRIKYGFDVPEEKYQIQLLEIRKEEDDFSDDVYSDPLDQDIIKTRETVVVKMETPEEEDSESLKKRGRPKKLRESIKRKLQEQEDIESPKKRKRMWKGDGEKKHICSYCSKAFSRQNVMKDHILTKHRKQDMIHACSQCPKRFATSYRLRLHEATHLPDAEKLVHPCPFCDKKFSQKVGAEVHINAMHLGEKSFTCEECGKSFSTKGALTEHKITHTDERPCQCSFCPKKFKNQRQLKQHESSHKESGHACPHCGLKLKSIVTLRMHLLVHSDKKKYKCNYCGNEYKRSKTFKSHLILHTGQRPYECPFCDKTFANGSNCRSHKKKAHPAELAALEATGKQKVTITPKLKYLQPKVAEFAKENERQ